MTPRPFLPTDTLPFEEEIPAKSPGNKVALKRGRRGKDYVGQPFGPTDATKGDTGGLKFLYVGGAKRQKISREVFGQGVFGAGRIVQVQLRALESAVEGIIEEFGDEFFESPRTVVQDQSERVVGRRLIEVKLKTAAEVSETVEDRQRTNDAVVDVRSIWVPR
jgi:hypothetical protein